eukprot:14670625-Heterocapsa_arctica.AAC.1
MARPPAITKAAPRPPQPPPGNFVPPELGVADLDQHNFTQEDFNRLSAVGGGGFNYLDAVQMMNRSPELANALRRSMQERLENANM